MVGFLKEGKLASLSLSFIYWYKAAGEMDTWSSHIVSENKPRSLGGGDSDAHLLSLTLAATIKFLSSKRIQRVFAFADVSELLMFY